MAETHSASIDDAELHLRDMEEADFPQIITQLNDPRVIPWLAAITQPFDLDAARALAQFGQENGVTLKVLICHGQVTGCLCLGFATWYWLDPKHWGKGLMQRAMTQALSDYFARPAPPLIATCRTDNTASKALLTRLGFSAMPQTRRMFFRTQMKAFPCQDFVLTPEQWHVLNPPILQAGSATLRPAGQKDLPHLLELLPGTSPWPSSENLPDFIEGHRFRGPRAGLFVIFDTDRQLIGAAMLHEETGHTLHLCEAANTPELCDAIARALQDRFG